MKGLKVYFFVLFSSIILLRVNVTACGNRVQNKSIELQEFEKTVVKVSGQVYRVSIAIGLKPNIGVMTGRDGLLMVDSGHTDVASEMKNLVLDLGEGRIHYLINTHSHWDHCDANEVCGEGAILIDYNNLSQQVEEGVLQKIEQPQKIDKDKYFKEYYMLFFNEEEVHIIPFPGIHSDSDILVYFTKSGVVHMGDLLLTQSFPAVGSGIKEYLEFLDIVLNVFPEGTKFIGGHGRDYTKQDVRDYNDMLHTTISIVREEIAAGRSMEAVQQADVLKEWRAWGEFLTFLNVDTWIEAIFRSY